jgi:hypothetical protein
MTLIQSLSRLDEALRKQKWTAQPTKESRSTFSARRVEIPVSDLPAVLDVAALCEAPISNTVSIHHGNSKAEFTRNGNGELFIKVPWQQAPGDWGPQGPGEQDAYEALVQHLTDEEELSVDELSALLKPFQSGAAGLTLGLSVFLDKPQGPHGEIFFASLNALRDVLAQDLLNIKDFERAWRVSSDRRTRIWVADFRGECHFTAFSILGPDAKEPPAEIQELDAKTIKTILDTFIKEVTWDERPQMSTPLCFQHQSGACEPIESLYAATRARLAGYFIPSHILRRGDVDALYFVLSEDPVLVGVKEMPPANAQALYDLWQWAYETKVKERLQIVRKLTLPNLPTDMMGFSALAAGAPAIFERSKTANVEQLVLNVDNYFKKRKELDEAVTKYVADSQKDILTLAKDMTDSFYKTVGAFVGTSVLLIIREVVANNKPTTADYLVWVYWVTFIVVGVYILSTFYHLKTTKEVEDKKVDATLSRIKDSDLLEHHQKKLRDPIEGAKGTFDNKYKSVWWAYFATMVIITILFLCSPIGPFSGWAGRLWYKITHQAPPITASPSPLPTPSVSTPPQQLSPKPPSPSGRAAAASTKP